MPTIEKDNLELLKKELEKKGPVFDVRENILPVKQYFLPGVEEIFVFDTKKKKTKTAPTPKPFVLFGLSLRDTEALVQLDEIMRKPLEDYFYFQKRNTATIISIIEEVGSLIHIGVDLILKEVNGKEYEAHPLTKKGKKITKSKLFSTTPTTYDVVKSHDIVSREQTPMPELRKLLLDPELLKDAVEWSWQGYPEIWEKLGKQCLGCGICTYTCPLCYCFSIEDTCGLIGEKCARTRKWTACTLPEFAKITGGHDFHPGIKERYYNWFYHKFVRAYKECGKSQCVACGRCKKYCPAGIDIEKILIDIIDKYKNK